MPDIDIKLNDVLKFENNFCVLPFIHEYIDQNNVHRLCCASNHSITKERKEEIKQLMLENKTVPECVNCLNLEKRKIISERQTNSKEWLKKCKIDFENTPTLSYDFRYSNLCNLRCQMCVPKNSSEWARYLGQEDIYKTMEPDNYKIGKQAQRIYLAGGEPFMIKSYSKMLAEFENKDCEIIINTNATILSEHMLKALDSYKNICFILSIDGTGKTIEYIRTLCSWEIIQKNIKILRERLNPSFSIHTVIQKDNIDNIPELAEWIDNQNIRLWDTFIVRNPSYLTIENYNGTLDWPDELWNRNCVKSNIQVQTQLKYIKDYFN